VCECMCMGECLRVSHLRIILAQDFREEDDGKEV